MILRVGQRTGMMKRRDPKGPLAPVCLIDSGEDLGRFESDGSQLYIAGAEVMPRANLGAEALKRVWSTARGADHSHYSVWKSHRHVGDAYGSNEDRS